MRARLTSLFPLWALGITIIAHLEPEPLATLKLSIVYLLCLVLFVMGLTSAPQSFGAALSRPGVVGLGLGLLFVAMPALAWSLAPAIGMPAQLLVGLVLVGASPGGTASIFIC